MATKTKRLKSSKTHFELSELVDDGFIGQVVDVLGKVESSIGRAAFVDLLLVLRFDRKDALEDTQTSF